MIKALHYHPKNQMLPIPIEIIFGAGLYTGVYVAQNYQIDKVEDPMTLFEKAQTYVRCKLADSSDDSKKGK